MTYSELKMILKNDPEFCMGALRLVFIDFSFKKYTLQILGHLFAALHLAHGLDMTSFDFSPYSRSFPKSLPLAVIAAIASSAAVPTMALTLLSLALGAEPQGLFTTEFSHPYAVFSLALYALSFGLSTMLGLPAHALLGSIRARRPLPFMFCGIALGIIAGYPIARLLTSAILFFPQGPTPFIGIEFIVCFLAAIIGLCSSLAFLFTWRAVSRFESSESAQRDFNRR